MRQKQGLSSMSDCTNDILKDNELNWYLKIFAGLAETAIKEFSEMSKLGVMTNDSMTAPSIWYHVLMCQAKALTNICFLSDEVKTILNIDQTWISKLIAFIKLWLLLPN